MEASVTFDVIKSSSPAQTQKIAQQLAKDLRGGDTVAIYGDLGAGKTVFVQGLAKALGIKRMIASPTFVLMRQYKVRHHQKFLTFYHLDLYRIDSPNELKSLGLEEIFSQEAIVVIEWADRLKHLPGKRIDVLLKVAGEKTRIIKIDRRF